MTEAYVQAYDVVADSKRATAGRAAKNIHISALIY